MSEPMTVRTEVWPLAADSAGIWLTSGADAWRPALPVPADSEPHAEVELLLAERGVSADVVLLHSTSWRVDGPSIVLTYVAVLARSGLVLDSWPDARPLGVDLARAVGQPPAHGAAEAPAPRYIDVLHHSVRHLAFLLESDATAAAVLDADWQRHLRKLTPTLAGMYQEQHDAA